MQTEIWEVSQIVHDVWYRETTKTNHYPESTTEHWDLVPISTNNHSFREEWKVIGGDQAV